MTLKQWCVVFALFLLALPCGAAPLLGVSLNLPEGADQKALVAEILSLRKSGAQMMYLSYKWSDLEPKPGDYNLNELNEGISGLSMLGFKLALTIQTIDTNNRTLPADLDKQLFDSPVMRARFAALLQAISAKLNDNVRWVSLGNEVDVYLGQHRAELEPFAQLVNAGRLLLREAHPGLKVGCTCTFGGIQSDPALAHRINRDTDYVSITYYPLDPNFNVRPVAVVPTDIAAMARFAAAKPMALQEAGYPADSLLGSSEDKQAAFVDALYDAVKAHGDKIAFVNYFLLCDFSAKLVDTFTKYYRVELPRFRAYLATLGLRRANNTPRKAWERFEARLKAWPK